jgi:hypothetical protein
MFYEDYKVGSTKYKKYLNDNGTAIYCKKINTLTYEEIKISESEFEENKPKVKLTLKKNSKHLGIKTL